MSDPFHSPSDADSIAGCAQTSDDGGWCYPGLSVESASCEHASSSAESIAETSAATIAGSVVTSIEEEWTYPGCAPSIESVAKSPWPYSTMSAAQPVVRKVTRIEEVMTWCYPGVEEWPASLVEVTVDVIETDASSQAMVSEAVESTYWPQSTEEEGYSIGGETERAAASTRAPVRSPSAIRTSKRKKTKELNPLIMLAGVIGGGVVGLFMGYCILYVIMVKIMGRGGDFSTFWQ